MTKPTITQYDDLSSVTESDYYSLSYNHRQPKKLNLLLPSILTPYTEGSSPFLKTCGVVVANLAICIKANRKLLFSMDTGGKPEERKYNSLNLKPYSLIKVMKQLEEDGYVTIVYGKNHPKKELRKMSEVTPTNKLIDFISCAKIDVDDLFEKDVATQQVLVLRDKQKNEVEWKETRWTKATEKLVTTFNLANLKHEWTAPDGDTLVQHTNRRVFNGSFHNGGRWYGAEIQQIKQRENGVSLPIEETRLGVTVNGKPVVEVDFACLHPTILAIESGYATSLVYGDDIYQVLVDTSENPAKDDRHLMKLALNIMLNAETASSAMKSIQCKINWEKSKYEFSYNSGAKVWAHIYEKMEFMQDAFDSPTSAGLELQYKDSRIAQYVVEHFLAEDKPCAIVHDSFVVAEEDEYFLCDVMADGFREVLNYGGQVALEIKRKDGSKERIYN